MQALDSILLAHGLLEGFSEDDIRRIAQYGSAIDFEAGKFVFSEGEPANSLYVIRHGRVSIEVHAPAAGSITIETVGDGEVMGWSWLFPPYRWFFDGRALEDTSAIVLDGAELRSHCEEDPRFGYQLMRRFAEIMVGRLTATRLRLLDLYSHERAR